MAYDTVIRIRTTTQQAKMLKKESDKIGLSVSAFVRLLIKNWDNGVSFEKKVR